MAPTWSAFFLAIPIAMIAYTGIETVSNLAEEARDPPKDIPRSIGLVAIAVFAIYFTLPLIALSALPVTRCTATTRRSSACRRSRAASRTTRCSGWSTTSACTASCCRAREIYVGILAATILFIATNAGVIGASRITYAMASYRQLPAVFRRLHPRFRTPWIALIVFGGIISTLVLLPGQTNFLGDMYAFGAMLSFTIAHASIVALRHRTATRSSSSGPARTSASGGVDWPLFAILGGLGTAAAWLVVVAQKPGARYVGLGWLAIGFVVYWVYRRRVVHEPLRKTVRAPALVLGPSLTVEYRTIVVPVLRTAESEEALVAAARLAAERRARGRHRRACSRCRSTCRSTRRCPTRRSAPTEVLDSAQALLESYGVRALTRLVRARQRRRRDRRGGRPARRRADHRRRAAKALVAKQAPIFGKTVDYVLKSEPGARARRRRDEGRVRAPGDRRSCPRRSRSSASS